MFPQMRQIIMRIRLMFPQIKPMFCFSLLQSLKSGGNTPRHQWESGDDGTPQEVVFFRGAQREP
jgi:hypothetical protein